jgi:uncharacterized membrane protein YheB (UPF0754 family)
MGKGERCVLQNIKMEQSVILKKEQSILVRTEQSIMAKMEQSIMSKMEQSILAKMKQSIMAKMEQFIMAKMKQSITMCSSTYFIFLWAVVIKNFLEACKHGTFLNLLLQIRILHFYFSHFC